MSEPKVKWEYQVVWNNAGSSPWVGDMMAMGAQGWELVSVIPQHTNEADERGVWVQTVSGYNLIYKRELGE